MNTKQCEGCVYLGRLDYKTPSCEHLNITGKCRQTDGNKCLSKARKKVKKK